MNNENDVLTNVQTPVPNVPQEQKEEVQEQKVEEPKPEEVQSSTPIIDNSNVISIECPNCGARLVGPSSSISIKCHWCHTVVPADNSMSNPLIPDRILPFKITKEAHKANTAFLLCKLFTVSFSLIAPKTGVIF
jgi:ribosomal protein S27E